ncbi:LytR/AlgR family response regulator transcription factor [Bifidobacterium samirii]|uniref:DNA-binding protein n=1 Tax=Bifidobacterium samirii TaxID=2306974 RepID=A0A430FWF8_9BIFI|nr:LytTR family DNA-binding domain-containing protein [Bifidobacterium samirii]RSX58705.1 DNA-binding protein [Bifidobacterium samirii]
MIRVAVCDDDERYAGYERELVQRWADLRGLDVHVDVFPSAETFLSRYETHRDYDILLLDVEMGRMDGVTLARTIRRQSGDASPQIVFVTGYDDYIADGYDVEALHYLIKPVDEAKTAAVLDRAAQRIAGNERCLNLQCVDGIVRIPIHQVRYVDVAQKNYATVHADRDHTVKRPLSDFEPELRPAFFRAGRALIVNLNAIRRVTRTRIELTDGTVLPLARSAYEPLNRAIIERT